MAAHRFIAHGNRSPRHPPVRRNGPVQLGWPHFWLLGGILSGILSLVALVFLAYLFST